MARKKTPPDTRDAKHQLAARLRAVRIELFGERGTSRLAEMLGIPSRTWYNYEIGVTVPAEVLLRLIEVTDVEPGWLLSGTGARYRGASTEPESAPLKDSVESILDSLT